MPFRRKRGEAGPAAGVPVGQGSRILPQARPCNIA